MNFWQQLRDAVRGQIEDFFRVRALTALLMLGVVAALIGYAWVRTIEGGPRLFGRQGALLCVSLVLLRFLRPFR